MNGRRIRRQNKGIAFKQRHHRHADDGLSRPAGERNHAVSRTGDIAGKRPRRFFLVITQDKGRTRCGGSFAQFYGERRTPDKGRPVVNGIAQFNQLPFYRAPVFERERIAAGDGVSPPPFIRKRR